MNKGLVVHDIKKEYQFLQIGPISFTLPQGILGLFGGNGSGKTTIIKMLMGNRDNKQGSVAFDGVVDFRSTLAYIPQGKCSFEKHVFPALLQAKKPIAGYVSTEYIKDMGTPDRWEKVAKDILSGKVQRLNKKYPRKAFFLDRDGVICQEVDLLHKKEQVKLIEGAAEAIRLINQKAYLAVIVTNQPVIARNLCSIDELHSIHNRLETLLGEQRAYVDAIYYCPHHPDKGYPEERVEYKIECNCRKPKPGMLLQAADDWNIDLQQSFMIGDRKWDVMAGESANVKQSVLIETNKAKGLLECVEILLNVKN